MTALVNLDAHLTNMLLLRQVLERIPRLVEFEDLLVNDRVNVVGLDGTRQILKQLPGPHTHAACDTEAAECLGKARRRLCLATAEESDKGDEAFELHSSKGIFERTSSTDFYYVGNALPACELLGSFAPICVSGVIDDVIGTKSLELLGLCGRRSGRDDTSASGFGKLQSRQL